MNDVFSCLRCPRDIFIISELLVHLFLVSFLFSSLLLLCRTHFPVNSNRTSGIACLFLWVIRCIRQVSTVEPNYLLELIKDHCSWWIPENSVDTNLITCLNQSQLIPIFFYDYRGSSWIWKAGIGMENFSVQASVIAASVADVPPCILGQQAENLSSTWHIFYRSLFIWYLKHHAMCLETGSANYEVVLQNNCHNSWSELKAAGFLWADGFCCENHS